MDFFVPFFLKKKQVQTSLLDDPNFGGNLGLRRIITPKMSEKQAALRLNPDATRKGACTQTSTKAPFFSLLPDFN